MTTQKIRTHHETLARENEKLTRQLNQQQRGQSNGKRVYVVEEEEEQQPYHEVNYSTNQSSFSFSFLFR
jgi:hypothetical protein